MKKSKYRFLLIVLLFGIVPIFAFGQYNEEAIKEKPFSKEQWEKSRHNLDYSGKALSGKEEKEEKLKSSELQEGRRGAYSPKKKENWSSQSLFQGSAALKYIFFGIAILALAFVIWKIMQNQMNLRNPKVRKQLDKLEEAVENIHETDLERFLREALKTDNYKLAIRIYYLMIIKVLSDKKMIKWKKDKTNNAYVREMKATEYYDNFKLITQQFERSWYGETPIKQADFQALQPKFQGFVQSIK